MGEADHTIGDRSRAWSAIATVAGLSQHNEARRLLTRDLGDRLGRAAGRDHGVGAYARRKTGLQGAEPCPSLCDALFLHTHNIRLPLRLNRDGCDDMGEH